MGHLPNGELVEENQADRNRGRVLDRAAGVGAVATASGRGMVMADPDSDGDSDIVVNNLRGFAQLFDNELCPHGASLGSIRRGPARPTVQERAHN